MWSRSRRRPSWRAWFRPRVVRGTSVRPVWRPSRDHSVWPWRTRTSLFPGVAVTRPVDGASPCDGSRAAGTEEASAPAPAAGPGPPDVEQENGSGNDTDDAGPHRPADVGVVGTAVARAKRLPKVVHPEAVLARRQLDRGPCLAAAAVVAHGDAHQRADQGEHRE